jgi:hypothetical protein
MSAGSRKAAHLLRRTFATCKPLICALPVWSQNLGGGAAAAVQPDFGCSASHSMEPIAHMVGVGCGFWCCSAASACLRRPTPRLCMLPVPAPLLPLSPLMVGRLSRLHSFCLVDRCGRRRCSQEIDQRLSRQRLLGEGWRTRHCMPSPDFADRLVAGRQHRCRGPPSAR